MMEGRTGSGVVRETAGAMGVGAFVVSFRLLHVPSTKLGSISGRNAPFVRKAVRKTYRVRAEMARNNGDSDKILGLQTSNKEDDRIKAIVRDVEQFEGTEDEARIQTVAALNKVSGFPDNISITAVYEALKKAGRLPTFGQQRNTEKGPTLREKAVVAAELPKRTGMPLAALTPRRSFSGLIQLGLIAATWGIAYTTRSMRNMQILQPIIYSLATAVVADQVILRGSVFDQIYSKLNPSYTRRVVAHEAGHFFIAYMHGLPVQRYALSAWDAITARVPGQAATLFADDELSKQLQSGRLANSSIDRFSVVAMAGLAAEGMMFGEATGGDADVTSLVRLLTDLKPAWDPQSIRIQARWAVVQAVSMIRENRPAYEALRNAMEQKLPLGECIVRIEDALRNTDLEKATAPNNTIQPGTDSSNAKNLANGTYAADESKTAKQGLDEVVGEDNPQNSSLKDKSADLDRREREIMEELDRVDRRVRQLRDEPDNDAS